MNARAELFGHFVRQELRRRYLGTLAAGGWALLHPLIQLAVYATVFSVIFAARMPEAPELPFAAWLAVAFWPWLAFSEALQRAAGVIHEQAPLIGKVPLPLPLLPAAAVVASFLLHGSGYLAVLLALALAGIPLAPLGIALALPLLALWFALALGLALLVSALSVFLRDLAQVVQQLLLLAFFLTPIFYARTMLPESWRPWLDLNPLTGLVEGLRHAWLGVPPPSPRALAVSIVAALVLLWLGSLVFRRTSRHFHDFL
ncbi:MAG: ABC transporter permease [Xanthomonadales bacterium]|nr:ABC transporter permease [Xanthomonadales bacterium]